MLRRDYLNYALVVFGWSTSWLPLKWQVGIIAPEVSLVWRFAIAALLCYLLVRLKGLPLRFPLRYHIRFFLMGIFIFSTNFMLYYYASVHLASGLLAVAFSAASMVNILMVSALTVRPPRLSQLVASAIGLGGIILIFWPELDVSNKAWISLMLCTAGTICFCSGNQISASTQKDDVPVLSANSWGMMYGCLFMAVIALVRGHEFTVVASWTYLGGLVWLSVFSSVIAFACYLSLVGSIGAGKAGYATVVFPVFALMISTMVEGYVWTGLGIIGVACVLAGNLIMARTKAT